jgi:integrase
VNEFLTRRAPRGGTYSYNAIKNFAAFCITDKKERVTIDENMIKLKQREPARAINFISDADKERVIDALKEAKHRVIAMLQNEVGARSGDVFRLERKDFSKDENGDMVVTITAKGGRIITRWVYNPKLAGLIDSWLTIAPQGENVKVFVDKITERCTDSDHIRSQSNYRRYRMDLKRALDSCGIPSKDWCTHDWRRGLARRVWDKYHDLNVLKEMLGHSDVETTVRYLRTSGLTVRDVLNEMDDDKAPPVDTHLNDEDRGY